MITYKGKPLSFIAALTLLLIASVPLSLLFWIIGLPAWFSAGVGFVLGWYGIKFLTNPNWPNWK